MILQFHSLKTFFLGGVKEEPFSLPFVTRGLQLQV